MGFSVSKPDFEHPDCIASSAPDHNNGHSIWLTRLCSGLTGRKT